MKKKGKKEKKFGVAIIKKNSLMSALDCDMLKLAPLFASLYVRLEIIYIVLINILIHTELL